MTLPRFRVRGGSPVHEQIEHWFHSAYGSGRFREGDRLPTERDLSAHLGVSRMTLRQALASLEQRGLVLRTMGRRGGTYVGSPRVIECDLASVNGFSEQMRKAGIAPGALVVEAGGVGAPRDVAIALGLALRAPTWRVVRVRSADGEPVALEESWFPGKLLSGFLDHDLTTSLYELLGDLYGRHPVRLRESLQPVLAAHREADLLGVSIGAPLMLVERTALDASGVPVEFARDLFRADRTRLVLWTADPTG